MTPPNTITVTIQPPGDASPITVSIPLSAELVQAKAEAEALAKVARQHLGSLELLIIRTIGRSSMKGIMIGRKLSMVDASGQPSVKVRMTLAGLIDRGVLDNDGEGEGYRLTQEAIEVLGTLGIELESEQTS